ncbi:MAG: glutamate-cysteine ligase family protein [Oscillospiraceae bacterium]
MYNFKLRLALIKFFESGIKTKFHKNIGLEVEHFILHANSLEAVPYNGPKGVKYIVQELMKFYQDSEPLLDEDLIGFSTGNFNITLEPAAQLEISITPFEDISIIEKIYLNFLNNINSILVPLNYQITSLACQPVSESASLDLIPKKRYQFMDKYFKSVGTGGIEMMRGTCSTQISIDFFSEQDFRYKIQAAYLLTPVFKLISNNATHFEGNSLNTFLKRMDIWNRTDPIRCQPPLKVFSNNFGFKDYADCLCKIPPIFYISKNGKPKYTGKVTAKELFFYIEPTKNDILHIISIAFPDVRLKNYIEIRGADSMPHEYVLAYCALIKGLLYPNNVLKWCQDFIHSNKITYKILNDTQINLIKHGWRGTIYGISAYKFVKEIIALALSNLPLNEQNYLEILTMDIK